ncbi:putative tryptophan--tRNA ligase [Ostertagia ostertagi]
MWRRTARYLCTEVRQHSELYFSGIQPTGVPHLGNYFGFIEPWVNLRKSLPSTTKMILAIADQHAISLGPKSSSENFKIIKPHLFHFSLPSSLGQKSLGNTMAITFTRKLRAIMACSLLACGVDPSRTLLFRQSSVPQISQLSWILGSLQTVAQLQRLPQYKEKATKVSRGDIPVGLLTYPILQAADVLMFKATHVPVGADQAQHMNMLADLADHFNGFYKILYFPRPQQVVQPVTSRLRSLRDPLKKMSKSEKSARSRLEISDSAEEIEEKCRKAVSDTESRLTYSPDTRPATGHPDLGTPVTSPEPREAHRMLLDIGSLQIDLYPRGSYRSQDNRL